MSSEARPDAQLHRAGVRPPVDVFVGRTRQMAALEHALEQCIAGHGQVIMLVGEPGIGKSRTAAEFAVRAERAGALILRGACYEGEWAPAYGPIAEALTEYVRKTDPAQLRSDLGSGASSIGRLVPALRERFPDVPEPVALPPSEERFRLFDSVAQFLLAASARRPLVLLLDDLHWAERSTLALLRHVARCVLQHPLLLLGAYRSSEVDETHPLTDVLGALRRESALTSLTLDGLSREETADLIAALAPAPVPDALVTAVSAQTEGNPFFIAEIVQHLINENALGAQPVQKIVELGLPDSVRNVIERRLMRTSPETRRLLTAGALFDGPFRYDAAAMVAGVSAPAALAAVEDALRARLIEPTRASDVYDFRHALIRQALHAGLSPSRRVRLQRQLAEAMETLHGRPADLSAEIAYQYHQSAALPGAERGARHAITAADRAERTAAWDLVATFLQMALHLLPEPDVRRPRLLARRGIALAWAMDFEPALVAARNAAEAIATAEGADAAADYLVEAVLALDDGGFTRGAFALAERGLSYAGNRRDATWARLRFIDLVRRGLEDTDFPGLPPDTPEWREFMWVLLELKHSGVKEAEDVSSAEGFLRNEDELRAAFDLADKYERLNRPARAALHWTTVFRFCTARGQFDLAREARQRLLALAAQVPGTSFVRNFDAAAEDEWRMARDEDWGQPMEGTLGPVTAGRLANWNRASVHAATARIHARMGNTHRAIRRLASVIPAIEKGAGWADNYIRVACDAAETLWLSERTEYVDVIERNLRQKVVVMSTTHPMMDGRQALGRVCALQGRHDEAREWFARARTVLNAQGARPLRAIVDYDEALMYLRRRTAGDFIRALPLLEAALSQFRAIGMSGWTRRAESLLRDTGDVPQGEFPRRAQVTESLAMVPRPLVGRSREIQTVTAVLERALGGRAALVLIGGEPGIGKTRLAEELEPTAKARGARVLWGRCWESGGAPAFWPWTQVLRGYARGVGDVELREMVGPASQCLRRIVPELADPVGAPPEGSLGEGADSERARFRLFDAVAGSLSRAARRRPLMLIFEDLHAADIPSLLLLQFVANNLHEAPVLVLGTHRETELRHRPDAAGLVAALARSAETLPLRGLSDDEVQDFLAMSYGATTPKTTAASLRAATGGNPFLLQEVAGQLVAEHQLDRLAQGDAALVIPLHARELLKRRFDLLPAPARELLRAAALIGEEFNVRVLRAISGVGDGALLDYLRAAREDALIVSAAPGDIRYRFRHALIREALAEELSPVERLALHRTIGEAIEAFHRHDLEPHLDVLAHHFVQAALGGEWRRAVQYARAAGERALGVSAYEDAVDHFEAALAALELADAPHEEQRCDLLLALGTARQRAEGLEAARDLFERAAHIARKLGRPDLFGRAVLGMTHTSYGRMSESSFAMLEEALAAQSETDTPIRAQLLTRLAHNLHATDGAPHERCQALSHEAVAIARRLGERRILLVALGVVRWVDFDPARFSERVAITAEMRSIAQQLRDPELADNAEGWAFIDALELGDRTAVDASLDHLAANAEDLKRPEDRWWVAVFTAMRDTLEGRYAEAEAGIEWAHALAEAVGRENAAIARAAQRAEIQVDRGQLEPVLARLEEFLSTRDDRIHDRCLKARLLAELGRLEEARRDFERLAVDEFALLPLDMRYTMSLASLAVVCARLGDERRAALLYDRLEPTTGRNLAQGVPLLSAGPSARYQGLLAATMRRYDVASRYFDEALAMCARMGWAPMRARTQCDYAAMLLRRGRRRDRTAARSLVDEALQDADRLGMALVVARARALRERCDVGGPVATATKPPDVANLWQREGDYWTITYERKTCRLRHSSGLRYLAELLRMPGREIHAIALVALAQGEPLAAQTTEVEARGLGDAGELLDAKARAEYRERLRDIEADLDASRRDNDRGRVELLQAERDAVTAELAEATGLGRRARRAGSDAERARLNVSRAIKTAIARIDDANPELGRHLLRRVRTGTYCAYLPDPRVPVSWTVLT